MVKSIIGILGWIVTWDSVEWAKDKVRNTTWGKAMLAAVVQAAIGFGAWFIHQWWLIYGCIGGVSSALVVALWAGITARRAYARPLIPNALAFIDNRIDVEWRKSFDDQAIDHREDLKASIRRGLLALDMVKTPQEYAKEEIAKIMDDPAHPFHHPEDSFHEMGLRRVIELKEIAYLKSREQDDLIVEAQPSRTSPKDTDHVAGNASDRILAPLAASTTGIPHKIISFDYFPASPLEHDWKVGYFDKRVNADQATKDTYLKSRQWRRASNAPNEGCVIIDVDACAIDYRIPQSSLLSTHLVCDFSYIKDAMLFALVGLMTLDGSKTDEGYIKFDLGRGKPRFVEQYKEWILPIDFPTLSNGWHHIEISLTDAVALTWGQEGWVLKDLRALRVRGHLGISPIRLW
jgi:hypothetical protein